MFSAAVTHCHELSVLNTNVLSFSAGGQKPDLGLAELIPGYYLDALRENSFPSLFLLPASVYTP